MKKNYVLDTNVLLYDPKSIFRFEDNDVIIPIYCIEEVDKFKGEGSERGRNARQVARNLDDLREDGVSLSEWVKLPSGGRLKVLVPYKTKKAELASAADRSGMDGLILRTALDVQKDCNNPTILVTMDTNLRIRSDAHGLLTQTYQNDRVNVDDLDSGTQELIVSSDSIDHFYRSGSLPYDEESILDNTCVVLMDEIDPKHTALGRYNATKKEICALRVPREGIMGFRPRNREQTFALDLLLDDSIKIVTLIGKAGSGKTLVSLAAGLQKIEEGTFTKMLVARPVMPLGKDIGFLPGTLEEKMSPWMQPIFDNLEFLFSSHKKNPRGYTDLIEQGIIQVEPLTYIRGRSLPQQYMVVDESQNLSPHEIKTIITRAGDGTKIILTGDPAQIDNPYVDSSSNGLTIAANKLRGQKIAGHIKLAKGERSELAELAANLL